jgi:prepilin-type N-terminal cleavage/methylation domain-containing protein
VTLRPGRGFTLVEVLVALVVTALVVLVAHRVFAVTIDAAHRLEAARADLDRKMNARRLLAAAFLSLDIGEGAGDFEGHSDRVAFASWLPTADGWPERRRVRLEVRAGTLLLTDDTPSTVALTDSVRAIGLDYLLEPGADAHWVGEWVSPVSAPLAVRLRVTRASPGARETSDTLLLLIKARG